GQVLAGAVAATGGGYGHQSTFELPAGTYMVRVRGTDVNDRSLLRSSYVLWLNRFRFGPEVVGDTLAVGDTVSGEAIEPLGDADVFVFHGMQGHHVNVAFQGTAPSVTGGLQAFIDGPLPIAFVQSPTSADSLGASQSNRIDLPVTGWYRIRVASWESPGMGLGDRGPYRLALTTRTTGPEQASEALVPGDSVTTEEIDVAGDWDEFAVTALPGEGLALVARRLSGNGYPVVAAFDSTTHDTLAWGAVEGVDKRITGSDPWFTMPASGRLRLAVYESRGGLSGGPPSVCTDPTCGGIYGLVGGYRFTVFPVNPSPEVAPATFALGDTVRGETLSHVADVDQFTGTGTPGDLMSVWCRLLAAPVPAGAFIDFRIVDPTTGALLLSGFSLLGGSPNAPYASPGTFTVPAGGTYVVRVHSGGSLGDLLGIAPYEFYAKRGS
ncbi:MAG: hypothetical protein ACRD08_09100, partial [Acidimicrobiales bacterium]